MLKIRSFPRNLALTRLKTNLFFLFLALTFRSIFTPYRTIRNGVIWALDEGFEFGYAHRIVAYCEYALVGVLVVNALQAGWSLMYPPPPPSGNMGRSITPSKPSSPLTRAYPTHRAAAPAAVSPAPHSPYATPTRALRSPQTPQTQQPANSPAWSSPLSGSTAALLGIKNDTTPSKTGFYYRTVKKENGEESVAPAATVGEGEGYVLVSSEDREWADNAWKGVRGKGGRLGL